MKFSWIFKMMEFHKNNIMRDDIIYLFTLVLMLMMVISILYNNKEEIFHTTKSLSCMNRLISYY